uniref:Uncharacterized protein n=1 Tax=Candidatus Kentrum sp. TUN TaxID=2126343 RepID=A0A451AU31_9GAMM|nr:MAG: hypothetical protein BECKTUN1418D_GA0071000_10377 [Candidatus Kentron sp. TUN]VFK60109.1 MAG: hypothetical protein BECKTUN1418F_GA0071002_12001 [Candidatus Kentron sp. TUN]VFK69561.1 MAG: hypothetical protein BECKTUN1418E_GA0071001_11987 [Candidatus Kentron sp. TUN]
MAPNTIIEDIHKIREEYAKDFNNDLRAICSDARDKQGREGRKVVPASPKLIQKETFARSAKSHDTSS